MSTTLPLLDFLKEAKDTIVLDVRSEAEYKQGHFPSAINLPLLNNEERKIVGTTYKQVGREASVIKGFELVGHKFADYIKLVQKLSPSKKISVYCWRGGMRSNTMGWLLQLSDFNVTVLKGGYKTFRNWALEILKEERNVIILGGKTCTGKTELLKKLKEKGEQVIDLEQLACHKGSTFGALGQAAQPSNEHFENVLALEWYAYNNKNVIWLENESNRIGGIKIPDTVFEMMRKAKLIDVELPMEQRLKRVLDEYGVFSVELLEEGTKRLEKRLGNLRMTQSISFLKENKLEQWAKMMLDYYDDAYEHSNSKRETGTIKTLAIDDIVDLNVVEQLIVLANKAN